MVRLADRLKLTWRFWRQGFRAFAPASDSKKTMLLWPSWRGTGEPTWQLHDLSNYIADGFERNAIIYSAIMYKVRAASNARLRAYAGTRDAREPLPAAAPLARLTDRPNPWQSFVEMEAEARVYFNLFGNAYFVFARARNNDVPQAIYTVRPDCVRHIYDRKRLKGFFYLPSGATLDEGTPLLPQDVMHVKLPNPSDQYAGLGKGLSPIAPLAESGDVDNAATRYLKLFFEMGAMPPGLLSFNVPLTDEDVASARNRWMEIYGGFENWSDVAILDNGGKYQRLGLSFNEMEMTGLDARNESRMAMVFGVPLTLIESRPELVQSTYTNKSTDRVMFWQDTLLPELAMFEEEWSYFLRTDDAFVAYDYSDVAALQPVRDERAATVGAAFDRGAATRAEYREALGLPAHPEDDVYKIQLTTLFVPAASDHVQDEAGAVAATDSDAGTRKSLPAPQPRLSLEQKQRVAKQIDQTATVWEGRFGDAAARAFEYDRRQIMALLSEAKAAAYTEKTSVAWGALLLSVSNYLTASKNEWRSVFAPLLAGVVTQQGEELNAVYGIEFDVRNLLAEQWFEDYTLQFVEPISATSKDEITKIFQQAMAEGWSVPQMGENLDVLFRQWIDGGMREELDEMSEEQLQRLFFAENRLPPHRREIIARTETLRASNAGGWNLYRAWGVPGKEWLSTNDTRTRVTHRVGSAWGKPPLIVPINQPFQIGRSQLMYPGDPGAPLSETAQCRCTTLPVFPEEMPQ